jgi:hypothetical protein
MIHAMRKLFGLFVQFIRLFKIFEILNLERAAGCSGGGRGTGRSA